MLKKAVDGYFDALINLEKEILLKQKEVEQKAEENKLKRLRLTAEKDILEETIFTNKNAGSVIQKLDARFRQLHEELDDMRRSAPEDPLQIEPEYLERSLMLETLRRNIERLKLDN